MLLWEIKPMKPQGPDPAYLPTKMAVGLIQGRFALFWDDFSEPDAEIRFNFKS